jgi:1-deoxy-D-xylulose-5-phosphate synthase
MDTLRCFGGVRGFPSPEESPYDAFVGGHAGVALSAALGMSAARDLEGSDEHIIAVVGDASLTNGISLEALNAIRTTTQRLILIINDNGMSISKNVGAFSRMLARRLSGIRYNRLRIAAKNAGHKLRLGWLVRFWLRLKMVLKPLLLRHRSAIFEDLGLRYMGPIDGHDLKAVKNALVAAKEAIDPVVLHIATVKGKGFAPAENRPSKWHGVAPWANAKDKAEACTSWSEVVGQTLVDLAQQHPQLCAITAAMRDGTGLASFFEKYPLRAYDVGICEGHSVAFAAGLAAKGLRPVVALYSSFAQRAVDNMMHEVCLQSLPVTLCLDRAGIVGADGPTHHGLYDIAMLRALPNVEIYAPCIRSDLEESLRYAQSHTGPIVIRYPRGDAPDALPKGVLCPEECPAGEGPILLALGAAVHWLDACVEALKMPVIAVQTIKPLPEWIKQLKRPVVTLEDAAVQGGFGSAVAEVVTAPHLLLGWPDVFVTQGNDSQLREAYQLDAPSILRRVQQWRETL